MVYAQRSPSALSPSGAQPRWLKRGLNEVARALHFECSPQVTVGDSGLQIGKQKPSSTHVLKVASIVRPAPRRSPLEKEHIPSVTSEIPVPQSKGPTR